MIKLNELCISFAGKTIIENFSAIIHDGDKIAIIGRNGAGKSSLLKEIANLTETAGYIPQTIEKYGNLSGGEKFNKALSKEIRNNTLLLDEPTNHLDFKNRKGLLNTLRQFTGTLVIVTHDQELLNNFINQIWHIENGKIKIFHGRYKDYIIDLERQRQSLLDNYHDLKEEKKNAHQKLMQEQERTAKSRASGKKKVQEKRWMKQVGDLKATKAEKAQGNKLSNINSKKESIIERLNDISLPERIIPHFTFTPEQVVKKILVSIENGSVNYNTKNVLNNINLEINSGERVAINGDNGSGKSTLIRAILNNNYPNLTIEGNWKFPHKTTKIGYLDQFYKNLPPQKTAIEIVPNRQLLSDFLFRKENEVHTTIQKLSGGEKARLSLALISYNTPELLILDEATNNLDLETKTHVTEVLKEYPGTLIVVSHDPIFLREINITKEINLT